MNQYRDACLSYLSAYLPPAPFRDGIKLNLEHIKTSNLQRIIKPWKTIWHLSKDGIYPDLTPAQEEFFRAYERIKQKSNSFKEHYDTNIQKVVALHTNFHKELGDVINEAFSQMDGGDALDMSIHINGAPTPVGPITGASPPFDQFKEKLKDFLELRSNIEDECFPPNLNVAKLQSDMNNFIGRLTKITNLLVFVKTAIVDHIENYLTRLLRIGHTTELPPLHKLEILPTVPGNTG